MASNQMSKEEKKAYDWLVNETKPERDQHKSRLTIISVSAFFGIAALIGWYWMRPTVPHGTSLLIGGGFYVFYGALLLALRAFSTPQVLALMSMPKYGANTKLFADLMKSRLSAQVGVGFIVGGFLLNSITMLLY